MSKNNRVDGFRIEISDVPASFDDMMLVMWLENHFAKNGEVFIDRFDISRKVAQVGFESESDAKEVLEMKELKQEDVTMYAKPIEAVSKNESFNSTANRTVELVGDFSNMSKGFLSLYCESRKNGGGQVEDIITENENGGFMVTFESPDVASTFSSRTHIYDGKEFSVILYESWPTMKESCAVKVCSDEDAKKITHILELVFENDKFGGCPGCVEDIQHDKFDEHTVVVVFHNFTNVKNIMEKTNGSIKLDDRILNLQVLKPAKPPRLITDAEEKKLLFTELGPNGVDDVGMFTKFIEKAAKVCVEGLMFCPSPEKVLVMFDEKPDYFNVLNVLCRKPIQGRMISVQKVDRICSIQVNGVEGLKEKMLELYFEHTRSGGGPVKNIELKENGKTALITFEDHSVIDNVIERKHKIDDKIVSVMPYVKELGFIPINFNCESPPPLLPEEIIISIQKEIYGFLHCNGKYKLEIESKFEGNLCQITWPTSPDKCHVIFSWKSDKPVNYSVIKKWPLTVKDCFASEVDKFRYCEISVPETIFVDFKNEYKKFNVKKEQVLTKFVLEDKKMCLCGVKEKVFDYKNKSNEVIDQLVKKYDEAKKIIKKKYSFRSAIRFNLIMKSTALEGLKNKNDIQIIPDENSLSICLKGQQEVIEECIQYLNQKVNDIQNGEFDMMKLCPNLLKFFENDSVIQHINQIFKKNDVEAEFYVDAGALLIQSFADIIEINKLLISALEISTIVLKPEDLKLLKHKEWLTFISVLKTSHKDAISWSANEDGLTFLTFKDYFDSIRKEVVSFIEENATTTRKLNCSSSVLKLLGPSKEYQQIVINAAKNPINVNVIMNEASSCFDLSGKSASMEDVITNLKSLCDKIHSKVFPFEKKALQMFMAHNSIILKGICSNRNVEIVKLDRNSYSSGCSNNRNGELHSNILVISGSIADQKTDVVFNNCDNKLDMNRTSISKAMLEKAGPGLMIELTSNYPGYNLKHGEIVKTKGYDIGCKCIYHGSIKQWNRSSEDSEKSIRFVISNALKEADEDKMTSISFPAFGTGKANVPVTKAAEIMIEEAMTFSQKRNSLKEIVFVIYEKETECLKAFQEKLSSYKSLIAETASSLKGSSKVFDSVTLEIRKTNLLEVKCGAIVNSTNRSFNVEIGQLSKMIIEKAGSDVLKECKNGKLEDNMAVTSAGKLENCKNIFHLTGRYLYDWERVISKMLKTAESMKLSSLSMPVLGTGHGSLTVEDMAATIIKTVNLFSYEKPKNLKLIIIAVPGEAECSKFLEVLQSKEQTHRGSQPPHQKSTSDVLKVEIFSMSLHNIDYAHKDLETEMKKVILEKEIDCHVKLPQDKVKEIERSNKVKITVKEGLRVKISGESDISDVIKTVMDLILHETQKDSKTREIKMFAKNVEWLYDDNKTWNNYGEYSTGMLEKAHQKQDTSIDWIGKDKVKHKVNLTKMIDDRNPGGLTEVKRVLKGSYEVPKDWDKMADNELFKLVPLDPKGKEYQDVQNTFHSGVIKPSIVKIERIQNPGLYKQYVCKKQDMEAKLKKSVNITVERKLWHGTAPANVTKIVSNNFNRIYAGAHGTAIGNGVYFAVNPDYSIRGYCKPDINNHKSIFLANVLTGNVGQGQGGLMEPPIMNNITGECYDSVADNINAPTMHVIFYDYQSYPEYLITFM